MILCEFDHLADGSQTPNLLQHWLWTLSIIDNIGKQSHYAKDMGLEERADRGRLTRRASTRYRLSVGDTSKEMEGLMSLS